MDEKSDPAFQASPSRVLPSPGIPSQSPLPNGYPHHNSSPIPSSTRQYHVPSPRSPHPMSSPSSRVAATSAYARPRGLRIANLLKPWIPVILYAMTSLGFLLAIAFWKAEVFQGTSPRGAALETGSPCDAGCLGLDQLSQWLKSDEELGYAVIFSLIFLTTIREYLMRFR